MNTRIAIALLLLGACQSPRTHFEPCTDEDCARCEGKQEYTCPRCEGEGGKRCADKMWNLCEGGQKRCPACNGTGETGSSACPDCGGTGRLVCQACQGTGFIECPDCHGEGVLPCGEWVSSP